MSQKGQRMFESILKFWFEDIEPKQWWEVDADFDALIAKKFSEIFLQASRGELVSWRSDVKGRLAEIIVLDQFSRNIYRGKASAFLQDPIALVLSQEAVNLGCIEKLEGAQRSFLLMPYMHSESRYIHQLAESLFKKFAPNNYSFEIRHKKIIDRFGRYPHRNKMLGRETTKEEAEFLRQPGSSF
tara:strand:+ start:242 stop:796 length:555 start_codon:yes stop_codon:yes gene_type:complete